MSHLMEASNQWADRPADERFWTLQEMHDHCVTTRQQSGEKVLPYRQIQAQNQSGELVLVGPNGKPGRLTNWSYTQLCRTNGAPPDFLTSIGPDLAADCINAKIRQRGESEQANLLFHVNGGVTIRSINSEAYGRIWNDRLTGQLLALQHQGWQVPPARPAITDQPGSRPATQEDCLAISRTLSSLAIQPGDTIAPAGLYASDRDMFAFLVDDENRIQDGSEGGLARGFFISNSEVGNGTSLKMTTFYYRLVCGNHIVWNATNVKEMRIIHRGDPTGRLTTEFYGELRKYQNTSAAIEEAQIKSLQRFELGAGQDAVIDFLFGKRIAGLGKRTIESAYKLAIEECADQKYGPNTAWGFTQGLTRHSQTLGYTSERTALDRAANTILTLAG